MATKKKYKGPLVMLLDTYRKPGSRKKLTSTNSGLGPPMPGYRKVIFDPSLKRGWRYASAEEESKPSTYLLRP